MERLYLTTYVKRLKIFNFICEAIATQQRNSDEILAIIHEAGYFISHSTLEKMLKALKDEFDAPIVHRRTGLRNFYEFTEPYNFKEFILKLF
jgi:hypothetical protein